MSERRTNKVNRVKNLLDENHEELKKLKTLFVQRKKGLLTQKRVSGENLLIEDLHQTLLQSKKNIHQIKVNLSKKKTDSKGMFRTLKNKMGYQNNSNVAEQESFSVSEHAIVISESLNLLRQRISNKKNINALEVRNITQVLLYNLIDLIIIFDNYYFYRVPKDQIIRKRDLDNIKKKLLTLANFYHIGTKVSDSDIRKCKRENDSLDDVEDNIIREIVRQKRFLKLKWSLRNLKEAVDKTVQGVIKLIPGIEEEDILETVHAKLKGSDQLKKFKNLYMWDNPKGLWKKKKMKLYFAISVYRLKFPFQLKLPDRYTEEKRNKKIGGFLKFKVSLWNTGNDGKNIRSLLS